MQCGLVLQKRLALVSQNGQMPARENLDVHYSWDTDGQPLSIQPPPVSQVASNNVSYSYTYDALGRPVGMTRSAPNPLPGFPPATTEVVTEVRYGPGNELTQMKYGGYTYAGFLTWRSELSRRDARNNRSRKSISAQ